MATVIPIWLRDIYAKVAPEPIFNIIGDISISKTTEKMAIMQFNKPFPETSFYIRGNELYSYLTRYLNDQVCNHVITFVVISLRDLYWHQRYRLSTEQLQQLDLSMNQRLPIMHNVFEYKSLNDMGEKLATSAFQLIGNITPFNVIHVPVRDFVDALNNNRPVNVLLPELNVIMQLSYELSDFWDPLTQQLLTNIPLHC